MLSGLKTLTSAVSALAACLALSSVTAPALAQESFPSKPIQFIVPYSAGGPLDGMARLLAEKVKADLGTVVVENKPGAGGNIGASQAAKAKPDGYTLVMGAVAINAINPWLYEELPFDPVTSFEPVILVASVPNVLILNSEFASKNKINRSEEHTSELQSLMRISYAVFCLKKNKTQQNKATHYSMNITINE